MQRIIACVVLTIILAGASASSETVPAAPVNLLRNAGLDGDPGFRVPPGSESIPGNFAWIYKSIGEIQSPVWWTPFWNTGPVANELNLRYRRPEYKVTSQRPPWIEPRRIDSGEHGLQFFGSFGAIDAGIYQRVKIKPGVRYRFSARGYSWSTCEGGDIAKSGGCDGWDPMQSTLYCGIDVTGATDFLNPEIIWGEGLHQYDAFADIPAVEAEAAADHITVFIRSIYRWGYVHNDTFIDTAKLVEVVAARE